MHLFSQNKYTRIYYQIIEQARKLDRSNVYQENHHIIPKSLGGNNQADNLVLLTAREHFVCHRLLTKMTSGDSKRKMCFAMNQMLASNQRQDRYKMTSRTYKVIKEQFNKVNHFNDPDWQKQQRNKRNYVVSESTREKMRQNWKKRRQNPNDKTMIGSKHSDETKMKISQGRKGKCVGKDNPFYGKNHTDEMKELFKSRPQNKTPPWTKMKKECPHCGKVLDPGNYTKHHGDNCKLNV